MTDIIFESVTPNDSVEDISKVKVRKRMVVSDEVQAFLDAEMPNYKVESKMYRLELIDADIAAQQVVISKAHANIETLLELRRKVEAEAKKVKLKKTTG